MIECDIFMFDEYDIRQIKRLEKNLENIKDKSDLTVFQHGILTSCNDMLELVMGK